ncbi:MAG: hypothetical protein AVDCRST_MAG66-1078 [uncultured Pseudonocardia sp.]|uniref:Uncharacterized protein n=1 Tax=uncultured Pseudonocardia sp. TaxID=211455 RepID=A0A6J4NQS3_9PSEU|nr:MAG: hypothetical protein AVDCRST_MAG66-1078 [uncultured Pseudonocardia sp.]
MPLTVPWRSRAFLHQVGSVANSSIWLCTDKLNRRVGTPT